MLVYTFYKVRSLFPRRLIFIKQSITRQTLAKKKPKKSLWPSKTFSDQVVEDPVFRHRHFGVVCHCLPRRLHFAWSKETIYPFIT